MIYLNLKERWTKDFTVYKLIDKKYRITELLYEARFRNKDLVY